MLDEKRRRDIKQIRDEIHEQRARSIAKYEAKFGGGVNSGTTSKDRSASAQP